MRPHFRLTHHAVDEALRRGLSLNQIEEVLTELQQIVPAANGRKAYQSKTKLADGRIMLVRAIVEEADDALIAVTVYRTSKFAMLKRHMKAVFDFTSRWSGAAAVLGWLMTTVSGAFAEAQPEPERPPPSSFLYVLNGSQKPLPRNQVEIPESLRSVVELVEQELGTEKHRRDGALVFSVRSADGKISKGRSEVHNLGPRHGGYRPGRITEGGSGTYYGENATAIELRVSAPGYHQFQRKAILATDQIIVWDDIILQPITPDSGATVHGTLWLEGNEEPEGILISAGDDNVSAFTDSKGRFTLNGLPEGTQRITAHAPDHLDRSTEVKIAKGASANCEIRAYRIRSARVEWAFQPDGTRTFTENLPGGTATLSAHGLRRVSFASGFEEVTGKGDMYIRQKHGRLLLDVFDVSGGDRPGFLQIEGVNFSDVGEAPATGYTQTEKELIPGAVFACKTYDGEHYGKLAVLRVDGGPAEAIPEAPPIVQRCVVSDLPAGQSGQASIAVLDFDHVDNVSEGTARACADLCRGVVTDVGRFIVVERQSMVQILGEEDFAATVKCDDTRCLVDYGKKLRAQKLLHGRLSKAGGSFVLTIKLLDVSSGKVDALETRRVQGRVDDLLNVVQPQTCTVLRSALTPRP